MSAPDPFRFDDAAYVLGALDAADRAAFEEHLQICPECRARVAEARSDAALLDGLTLADVQDGPPMPDTLLPGLLRNARRERTRRRWLTSGLAAVAAACAAALVVALWPAGSSGPSTPAAQAMVAVRPSPVAAQATLIAKGWGTEVDLRCRYADKGEQYRPYQLVVIDRMHHPHIAGSWLLAPGRETTFTGGTSVRLQDISAVQITMEDGTPILQLTT